MKGTNDKTRQVISVAKECGYEVSRTRKSHLKMWHPVTKVVVFAPSSPSDYRGVRNVISELRRKSRTDL